MPNLPGIYIENPVGLLLSLLTRLVTLALRGTGLAGWLLFGPSRRSSSRARHVGNDQAPPTPVVERFPEPAAGAAPEPGSQDLDLLVHPWQPEAEAEPDLDLLVHPSQQEVDLLRGLHHGNVIKLRPRQGEDGNTLVYEHTEKGSLHKWLHLPEEEGKAPISWPTRRAIATGVAGGLRYLHRRRIVHHNINSTNILLHRGFKPKIASFGRAQQLITTMPAGQPSAPICQLPAGNFGYTAPDYVTMIGELTEKVDVYSFGVLLLELITGRVANIATTDGHLATWAHSLLDGNGGFSSNVVDQSIPHRGWYMTEMAAAFRLGVDCTARYAHQRPSMQRVLKRLHKHASACSWIKCRLMSCLL